MTTNRSPIAFVLLVCLTTASLGAPLAGAYGHEPEPDGTPDLTATLIETHPEQPYAGQEADVEIRITNEGNGTAERFAYELRLDGDRLNRSTFHELRPGHEMGALLEWPDPPPGNHTLQLVADVGDDVDEPDETDNTIEREVHVREVWWNGSEDDPDPDRPDLGVTEISSSPEDPKKGDEVRFDVTIENHGEAASPATRVRVDVDEATLDQVDVPALDPGENVTVTSQAWEAEPGNHTVNATLDPDDGVDDPHAEDDERTERIHVDPCRRGLEGLPCRIAGPVLGSHAR
jgi:subtilase family serine protease